MLHVNPNKYVVYFEQMSIKASYNYAWNRDGVCGMRKVSSYTPTSYTVHHAQKLCPSMCASHVTSTGWQAVRRIQLCEKTATHGGSCVSRMREWCGSQIEGHPEKLSQATIATNLVNKRLPNISMTSPLDCGTLALPTSQHPSRRAGCDASQIPRNSKGPTRDVVRTRKPRNQY